MQKIQLLTAKEMLAREKLDEIPIRVQQYLDLKEWQAKGKYFWIVIEGKSVPHEDAGVAYFNALQIKKFNGRSWIKVYDSGMRQYRGAYATEIDDWDLELHNPAILQESPNEVVYGLSTGAGKVKIFRFNGKSPKLLHSFNAADYERVKDRIKLLQNVVQKSDSFICYVNTLLGRRWHFVSTESLMFKKEGDVKVALVAHSDRDYDPIVDCYYLLIWVQGRGIGTTQIYNTGLYHPVGSKFYNIGVALEAKITSRDSDAFNLTVKVGNSSQRWQAIHLFQVVI